MEKIEQLRREVKADFTIMHALYSDLAMLVGQQNEQLGEQQEQLGVLQGQLGVMQRQLGVLQGQVGKQQEVSREMVKVVERVQGQHRQQSERFDAILDVISHEIGGNERVAALEHRVEAIERKLAS